jgi:hypothetical protein
MPVSINLPGHSRDFAGRRNTLQIGASPATVRDALAARVFPTKPAPRIAIFVMANVSPRGSAMHRRGIVLDEPTRYS